MADDKSRRDRGDRKRVAADQGYEVSYLARKHGLSSSEARTLIARFGNDRIKLNAEAEKMATRGRGERRNSNRRADSGNQKSGAQSSSKLGTGRSSALTKAAAVGGVVAAGALLWSRRAQIGDHMARLSDEVSGWRQGSQAHTDYAAQGTSGETFHTSSPPQSDSSGRTQADIAAEALSLKQIGGTSVGD